MVYSSSVEAGSESVDRDSLKGGDVITSIANETETDRQGVNATISERRPRDDDLSSAKLNVTDGKHVIAPDAS